MAHASFLAAGKERVSRAVFDISDNSGSRALKKKTALFFVVVY